MTRVAAGALGLGLGLGLGCTPGEDRVPRSPIASAATAPGAALSAEDGVALDPRDQYALASEMLAARRSRPEAQDAAFEATRVGWEGRRYRWEMMRVLPFCTAADRCLFAPFDLARSEATFAFLPLVRFSGDEHARMTDACSSHGVECVVTFEGTLSELVLGVGAATSMRFSEARLVSARRRRENEHFLSRPDLPPAARTSLAPLFPGVRGAH